MAGSVFYERAVALDKIAHKDLRVQVQSDHYSFAHETNALPVAATEFADAARHYPIVFVGAGNDDLHASVLLGLEDRNNLFVSADGQWAEDTYIPAFARRYPFVLGTTGEQERMAVCIDEAYSGLNDTDGVALFDGEQESDYLKQMMEFLRVFQGEMERTRQAVQRLHQLGLLVDRSITLSQDGQDRYLSGFRVVDDEKFAGLDDERIVELHRSGVLRLVELHRASLGNVQRLAARLDRYRRTQAQNGSGDLPGTA